VVEWGSPEHGSVSAMVTDKRIRSHSGEVLLMWEGKKVTPQHENEDRTEPMTCSQICGGAARRAAAPVREGWRRQLGEQRLGVGFLLNLLIWEGRGQ
jgi:hypothetical protein